MEIELTSDMVLCTVQHIGCMDELITGPSYPQFSLCVPQHYLPPVQKDNNFQIRTIHKAQ